MAKTGQQRQQAYEQRLKDQGGRIIKVALEPETVRLIDEIKGLTGMKTNKELVRIAVMALHVKVKEMAESGQLNHRDGENA